MRCSGGGHISENGSYPLCGGKLSGRMKGVAFVQTRPVHGTGGNCGAEKGAIEVRFREYPQVPSIFREFPPNRRQRFQFSRIDPTPLLALPCRNLSQLAPPEIRRRLRPLPPRDYQSGGEHWSEPPAKFGTELFRSVGEDDGYGPGGKVSLLCRSFCRNPPRTTRRLRQTRPHRAEADAASATEFECQRSSGPRVAGHRANA